MGNNHCEGEYVSTPMQKECAVCGEPTRRVMGLPNFPLTDTYSFGDAQKRLTTGIDQEWRYCEKCGHGQLGEVVSPGILYGNSYYFRTSESATGRDGCDFFLSFLDRVAQGKTFNAVLDLGCNDLYLLKQLKSRTKRQIGVDPIWTGREEERDDKSIQVFGGNIETLDLISKLDCKPDLIVCRHTLEHIEKPQEVLKILMELASDDALFIFEVPGLDGLLQKYALIRFSISIYSIFLYLLFKGYCTFVAAILLGMTRIIINGVLWPLLSGEADKQKMTRLSPFMIMIRLYNAISCFLSRCGTRLSCSIYIKIKKFMATVPRKCCLS